jgi:hypothetical protein
MAKIQNGAVVSEAIPSEADAKNVAQDEDVFEDDDEEDIEVDVSDLVVSCNLISMTTHR